jgi:hypothetical protein
LSTTLPTLASVAPSPPWDFDANVAINGIILETYLNDSVNNYNDCVIAARAHQTIRLVYVPGTPSLAIRNDEVSQEYFKEDGNSTTAGLDLATSLGLWRDDGWTAGGASGRKIEGFSGPFSVNGSALLSGNPILELSNDQLMGYIFEYTGVQVDLLLPDEIDVRLKTTYGAGNDWSNAQGLQITSHVMLLTGYDVNGPIGITWGVKQSLTWDFLRWCCVGVFVVHKGQST